MDQGLEVVKDWLYQLFHPYVVAGYRLVRAQHGLPPMLPAMAPDGRQSDRGKGSNIEGATMSTSGHLALFNQHLQKGNREVEWIYANEDPSTPKIDSSLARGVKSTPVWYVRVMVDGEYFGKGRGNTKKAARNEAAKEGLQKLGVDAWSV